MEARKGENAKIFQTLQDATGPLGGLLGALLRHIGGLFGRLQAGLGCPGVLLSRCGAQERSSRRLLSCSTSSRSVLSPSLCCHPHPFHRPLDVLPSSSSVLHLLPYPPLPHLKFSSLFLPTYPCTSSDLSSSFSTSSHLPLSLQGVPCLV